MIRSHRDNLSSFTGNQKMEIFIIRGTHIKPTFFETLGILKCKKKVCAKFFQNVFFYGHRN